MTEDVIHIDGVEYERGTVWVDEDDNVLGVRIRPKRKRCPHCGKVVE